MIILVDAMGGDNAPEAIVNGCIDALIEAEGFDIVLIGDSQKINEIIGERKYEGQRLKVHHASEVITNDDIPTKAIKTKKDSSMVVGFNMLKEGKGDVFVSAGNSGALLAGALLLLGRIKGVERPALGAVIPVKDGRALIIDAGLNASCKPVNYLQFGILGSIYMRQLFDVKEPRVGLINMGTEVRKGNETIRNAFSLLSESKLNFIGNIEGKDITEGKADVIVCDGFVGNVMLKLLEGAASFFTSSIKEIFKTNLITMFSALLLHKSFKKFRTRFDPDLNGGAPILGVNGVVIKSHGSSKAKTIKHVIIKASYLSVNSVIDQIKEELGSTEVFEGEDEI